MKRLTAEQVAEFKQQGLLIARDVLTDADLQPVIDGINQIVDERARDLYDRGFIQDLHEDKGFEQRYAYIYKQSVKVGAGLDIMQLRSEALFRFLFNDHLLDALEDLIGPELACNPIQHLRAKLPTRITGKGQGLSGNVPWHQDVAVTWEEADHSDIITCWIPLVDATAERGCMQVIPGISDRGYLEHQVEGGTTIKEHVFPHDVEPITAVCPRGGIVFMDKFTPHMGMTNQSDVVRWTLDLRYQPIGHASGRPFQPSFIVRSKANPESVEDDFAAWGQRWDEALENSKGYSGHRTVPKEQRIPAGQG